MFRAATLAYPKTDHDLSRHRKVNVANFMAGGFGMQADYIETMGLVQTEPVASNITAENKSKERCAEIIRHLDLPDIRHTRGNELAWVKCSE